MGGSIDWQMIRQVERDVGNDSTRRLLRIFATECEQSCKSIVLLAKSGDWQQVEIIAHSLKSSARQFGAIGLSELCHQLEAFAGNGEATKIDHIIDTLLPEVKKVRKALAGWLDD